MLNLKLKKLALLASMAVPAVALVTLFSPVHAGKEPVVIPESSNVVGALGLSNDDSRVQGLLQNDPVGTGQYASKAGGLLSGIKTGQSVPTVGGDCVGMSADQLEVLVEAVSATGDDVVPAVQRLADQLGAELTGVGLQVTRLDMSSPSYDSAVTSVNNFILELSDAELEMAVESPTLMAILALLRNDDGSGCNGSSTQELHSDLAERNLDDQVAIIRVSSL